MKKTLFIFNLLFALHAYGGSSPDPIKELESKSAAFVEATEDCQTVINSHTEIVEASEKFIESLIGKKKTEISPYEITMLQKILTNRFLHLTKAVNMYRGSEEATGCSPKLLGHAIAVYDFTQLGNRALKDSKLRRIVLNFTNFPKYKMSKLKELYDHYTSAETINDLIDRMNEEKIALPENINLAKKYNNGASFYALSDAAVDGTSSLIGGATRVWGFISDQFKWRNGRLNKNEAAKAVILDNLRPLDIIYEKREFTLSNYTIPGHWGHVAVWLGTKEELIELGVWDKDYFAPFKKFVEEGKNIVEVRKKGLNAQSLENFLNLDEIAVTRISNAEAKAPEIIKEMTEQIDKKYDFTFNAQSTDKLTCAEFIAFSYGNIKWPETQALFQVSLRPDDLALLTLYKNSPAEFILYLKGKKDGSFDDLNLLEWRTLFEKKGPIDLTYIH